MKTSAGLLLYRFHNKELQVFLIHPGGPFWKNKDAGAWSIPKGEPAQNEDLLEAAKREFKEETGFHVSGKFIELSPIKQKSGKLVYVWALEKDVDAEKIKSNLFELEWPPKSGKKRSFPEVDKAAWFSIEEAKEKINPAQAALIDQLKSVINKK